MSDEGQRIEFGDAGPYLFDTLDGEPQGMLLDEHEVCLLQIGELYLPVSLDAGKQLADGLANLSQADMGPERKGMMPVTFDLEEMVELPLVTGAASEGFQYGETIYIDVQFGDTQARLCFSILTAAAIGQILSQIPS